MSDETNELLYEFLSESEEHLQVLNDKMLDVEASIKNNTQMSTDDLNTMFRSAHTIKGTASFIDLKKVVSLTHKAETLLQKLRDKEMGLTAEIVDTLFSAFDTLTALLNTLKETSSEDGVDIDGDVNRIESILDPQAATTVSDKHDESQTQEIAVDKTVEAPPTANAVASQEIKDQIANDIKQALLQGKSAVVEPPKVIKERKPINEKYLQQFLAELTQNVEDIESLLLTAETEVNNTEIVNDIFRIMHTVKGSAGIVNVAEIAELSHEMENILSVYREKHTPLSPNVISLLINGNDFLRNLLEELKKKRRIDSDISGIVNELAEFSKISLEEIEHPVQEEASPEVQNIDELLNVENLDEQKRILIKKEINDNREIFIIKFVILNDVTIKLMKFAIIEERLKKNGQIILTAPSEEVMDQSHSDLTAGVVYTTSLGHKDILPLLSLDGIESVEVSFVDKSSFIQNEEVKKEGPVMKQEPQNVLRSSASNVSREESSKSVKSAPPATDKTTPIEISTIKIDARKLDKLMNLSGELVIIRAQYARLTQLFGMSMQSQKELVNGVGTIETFMETLKKEMNTFNSGGKALDESRLNSINKTISEISGEFQNIKEKLGKNDIIDYTNDLSETTSSLEKVSSDIQAGVMQTRMVPIEGVFTRFKRIVRDISKDINKEVNLHISGAETELDKKIVDSLGDPLTHMIRNAVDHGIDSVEDRLRLGKPKVGTVILKASHKGNSICIEVGDDGKGVDADRLAESAIKKGLLTQEQTDRMTEKEKLNIMFLPGFSTAEKVTGLSGRGVGMDVVRSMITSLNGVVDIETAVGKGTTFVLKIPLTLAIIQSLLVSVNDDIYAFPLESVTEIIKISEKDIYSVDGNATVKLRDHALSLIDLEKVLKTKSKKKNEKPQNQKVVIISDGETQLGVTVDSLVGKDEIVIKPFTEHFSNVKGLTGASILANGSVALILDPATIIKESR